jgi:hypothetical protein
MAKLRCALLLLICGLAPVQAAPEGWQTVWLPEQSVLLGVPPGWRLQADRGAADVRLLPPPGQPAGEEVLIHAWTSAAELTPALAAAEYRAELPAPAGEVSGPAPLTAVSGQVGALLTGTWAVAGQQASPAMAIVVYTSGTRAIALVLRCPRDRAAAARKEYFDLLAIGLRPPPPTAATGPLPAVHPPAPGPATPPVTPPAPTPTPAPPLPPTVPPIPGPVTPPAGFIPPPPKFFTLGGFSLLDVEGYRGSLTQGTVWLVNPGGASGFCLWPARVPEGMDPQELLAVWAKQNGMELNLLARRATEEGLLISATLGEARQRAVFYLSTQGETALVLGLYAPAAEWGQQAPRLAGWLAQVKSGGWRRALPAVAVRTQPWVDQGQNLFLQVPEGWKAVGGVERPTGRGAVTVAFSALGDDCQLNWQQPAVPAFRELTPILESLGEREGSTYRETEGEDYLRILNRRKPAEYVRYLLEQPSVGMQQTEVQSSEPSEALAGMLPGPDNEGAIVRVSGVRNGQLRERLYLVATGPLPLREGAFRWQGAYLSLDYPAGEATRAYSWLRAMLESARPVVPEGQVAGVLTAYLQSLREGLKSLALPEAPLTAPASLLEAGYEPAGPGAGQFSVEPALESWRALLQQPGGLPELQ